MVKKLFKAHCKPSKYLKNMTKHDLRVDEGNKSKVIAIRTILGKRVTFYQNGLRFIEDVNINEEEQFDSQILRFAHASILIEGPVGDKKACYVDATKNPVEVWIYDYRLEDFIKKYTHLMRTGRVDTDFLLEEPLKRTIDNERNVRLS